jgi:hypothetical protein
MGSLSVAGMAATTKSGSSTVIEAGTLSNRVVDYNIEAWLDVTKKTIDATELLTYRNLTGHPLQVFPFHLYMNAFQPKSTFMRERQRDDPSLRWEDKHLGSVELKLFEVVGMGDLTSQLQFIQPDDNNIDDRTVVQIRLPRPLLSGTNIQFKIVFHEKLPETLARTGYIDDFFLGGQWFPKVGVWWHDAWNCHQFHAHTEFFADFGTYEVRLTLPQNYLVGSSGDEVASVNNSDGTKTVTWRAEDVHDFAWTASPHYQVVEDTWRGSSGPVKIRIMMQPVHMNQAGRYMQSLKGALKLYDRWYGAYPYDQITVVDPPINSAAGGMEYPTFITGGSAWLMPDGLRGVEMVTVHEFGHQYWYGMVATNEFEEAWLDEGVNSYTQAKVMAWLYGTDKSMVDLLGVNAGDGAMQRINYIRVADTDPLARHAWQFMSGGAYSGISYAKASTALQTLEGLIGEENMRQALRTYFTRFGFKHPSKEDFLTTIEEVSGRNLRWFLDQAVDGTQVLDYEVKSLSCSREDWLEKNPAMAKKDETFYRTTVLVHRKGDFIFPVEVEVKFDNGEKVREQWDGRDRWVRYTYRKKAKLVSAEIDPDHKVWLDCNFLNNSRTVEPHPAARQKLLAYTLLVWQFIMQTVACLV